jgi:hypothetical protein
MILDVCLFGFKSFHCAQGDYCDYLCPSLIKCLFDSLRFIKLIAFEKVLSGFGMLGNFAQDMEIKVESVPELVCRIFLLLFCNEKV